MSLVQTDTENTTIKLGNLVEEQVLAQQLNK